MTTKYLAKLEHGNIGVVLGAKSGNLIALDVDDDSLVESYLTLNPFLNDTLQTHGARGRVFWLRMTGDYPAKTVKLKTASGEASGEFRSNRSQSIIHGIHPSGKPYEIVNLAKPMAVAFSRIVWPSEISVPPCLPNILPKADWTEVTEVTEDTDVAEVAEVAEAADVIVEQSVGGFSLVCSVDEAVNRCLPNKIHENNIRLFDLARALLTLTGQGVDFDHDEVFDAWHKKAEPFLRPELKKEDYFLEFLKACHRARVPLGSARVTAAWERANQNLLPLPPKVMAIQKPGFQLLCAFYREMQAGEGVGKVWFVAGGLRACAKLLGHKHHSTVETWTAAMHTMKVLKTIQKGDAHHSTRFVYLPTLPKS